MSVKSGMNYSEMENLISFVEQKRANMVDILDTLEGEMPPQIAASYSGEAATTYQNTLKVTANSMNQTLQSIIDALKLNATEMQTQYEQQDRKMQDSATVGVTND